MKEPGVVSRLEDKRVLEIIEDGEDVHFDECCDYYFRCTLSRQECRELGEYLIYLSTKE